MQEGLVRRRLLAASLAMRSTSITRVSALEQGTDIGKVIVDFPAGGTADSLARVIAPLVSIHGRKMIVKNRPGASGQLAPATVRQAAPDGRTLLPNPSAILSLVPHLYKKPMSDSLSDFAPFGAVCDHLFGFDVSAKSSFTSGAQRIWAKSNPNEATFATTGPGAAPHLLGTVLAKGTGAASAHVPHKGVAPGLQDFMGRQIAATFNSLPTLREYHRKNRIRILAATNSLRVSGLSEVPTFSELGLASLELLSGTDSSHRPETRSRCNGKMNLSSRAQSRIPRSSLLPASSKFHPQRVNASGLRRLLEADWRRWQALVEEAEISSGSR